MLQDDKKSCYEEFCHENPLIIQHLKAVLYKNQSMNLTSIKSLEAGKVLHIQDSLAVVPFLEKAPPGAYADLGSGAGYPGLPLALASNRKTTLIEASKKKARFLEDFVATAGLKDLIIVEAKRSEELALEKPRGFSVITARAVAELPVLLELVEPLLSQGGMFLALKGRPDTEELERGLMAASLLGFTYRETHRYTLEQQDLTRHLIVYEKQEDPSILLPRRPGKASKSPLA